MQSAGKDAQALQWNVSYSEFAHPQVLDVNIIGSAMGPFVFAANMFNFVLLVSYKLIIFKGQVLDDDLSLNLWEGYFNISNSFSFYS